MYDLKDKRWITNINQLNEVNEKVVLTFDDGPGRHLESILDILKEKNVQAMFFWQSRLMHKERPWQRVLNEGHLIGTHAHNHKNLVKLSRHEQLRQISISKEILENTIGEKIRFFRPPFGQYNEDTMSILHELQLTPIMWDITSYDWENKNTPNKIVCNIVNYVTNGSIILLHELEQTVSILPELIDNIREKNLEFCLLE